MRTVNPVNHFAGNLDSRPAYPMAVETVPGQAIVTDTAGIQTGVADIPVADGTMPAYFAHPVASGRFPVVLVVHEIFGVHEHIRDICRRLAKRGYLAIAPELFSRIGDLSKVTDISEMLAMVGGISDFQIMSDIDATLAWASQAGTGDGSKLTITGFCWGGRITWLYCAHNSRLLAGVAWYGRLEGKANELQPVHPLDLAGRLHVPVLGLYGGADQSIPLDSVERMRLALPEQDPKSLIVVYPDAPHAFFADYRPSYRREPAEDAWRRLLAWLNAHGAI